MKEKTKLLLKNALTEFQDYLNELLKINTEEKIKPSAYFDFLLPEIRRNYAAPKYNPWIENIDGVKKQLKIKKNELLGRIIIINELLKSDTDNDALVIQLLTKLQPKSQDFCGEKYETLIYTSKSNILTEHYKLYYEQKQKCPYYDNSINALMISIFNDIKGPTFRFLGKPFGSNLKRTLKHLTDIFFIYSSIINRNKADLDTDLDIGLDAELDINLDKAYLYLSQIKENPTNLLPQEEEYTVVTSRTKSARSASSWY